MRAVLLVLSLAGCASYNAMWNAQRHANDARRLEQLGQTAEARAQWAQAATKAASVRSDKALVLRVEALAYSGDCGNITEPLTRARALADRALRERVELAEAECAITSGDAGRAETALALPLTSRNAARRSRAEYGAARAALLRRVARASGRAELQPIIVDLSRLLHTVGSTDESAHYVAVLTTLTALPETPAARFQAAEMARDSLQAPQLAGHLFLEAAGDTASLFAPKALIAALPLLPDRRDSIMAVLDSHYAGSPYTRALHGEASFAYAAAEDSLARELGISRTSNAAAVPGSRSDIPISGPRGPKLP